MQGNVDIIHQITGWKYILMVILINAISSEGYMLRYIAFMRGLFKIIKHGNSSYKKTFEFLKGQSSALLSLRTYYVTSFESEKTK